MEKYGNTVIQACAAIIVINVPVGTEDSEAQKGNVCRINLDLLLLFLCCQNF